MKKKLLLVFIPFILTPAASIASNNILSVHILNQQTGKQLDTHKHRKNK